MRGVQLSGGTSQYALFLSNYLFFRFSLDEVALEQALFPVS
jgi:hypothetical protein